jgi:DNA-binding NtrC family response regulator
MRLLKSEYNPFAGLGTGAGFRNLRIRSKLSLTFIPPVVLILVFTGYLTHWFSKQFLQEAIERNVQVQTLAIAHEVEIFLRQSRDDLKALAQGPIRRSTLRRFAELHKELRGAPYPELAYISKEDGNHLFVSSLGEEVTVMPSLSVTQIRPNPLLLLDKLGELREGDLWISDIVEAIHPVSPDSGGTRVRSARVIRLVTPYYGGGDSPKGLLMLSIDLLRLREILSLFNSPRSPIYAYVRSPEVRYSYLFDKEGWMLFQSEGAEDQGRQLSVEVARAGLSGTLGKPGLESAFRPQTHHEDYWRMVKEVRQGRHGVIRATDKERYHDSWTGQYFLGYAPVRFERSPGAEPAIFCGVAYADRSRLTLWAGYRQIDVIFVVTLFTILLISSLIFALSRVITKPSLEIAAAVSRIQQSGRLEEIVLPDQDYETSVLRRAINDMIATLRRQMEEIRIRDEQIEAERQRERVRLEEEIQSLRQHLKGHELGEIVGAGPVIEALRAEVLKAASVDADVLIVGETGTGKQLVAEAIHRHSKRSAGPFVSINCGALDENLLMDSLFGHVKGAFTEAKGERKGAFLAAHGGTLFLDEIGAASLRVQQSLLRAISMRKVRPLGSDQETDVDVRVIAATNVDLREQMEKGLFREDLFYRLEVLTIRTPALRDHKESIPVLVDYFLKQACRLMNRDGLGLSRGALEKLTAYHWPGNVRELMNCVTRSVAMVTGSTIHAEDIWLGGEEPQRPPRRDRPQPSLPGLPDVPPRDENGPVAAEMNRRQRKALPFIIKNGGITRVEYQKLVGDNLPSRTAVYDLSDLVKKGILRKVGKGPATRYHLARLPDSAR